MALIGIWASPLPAAAEAAEAPPASETASTTDAAVPAELLPELQRTWVVGNGDSWFSMRSRMCPVDDLQAANPGYGDRPLQIGDRLVAPFVSIEAVEQVRTRVGEMTEALATARARLDAQAQERDAAAVRAEALQKDLQSSQAEVARLVASDSSERWIVFALGGAVVLLLGGLVVALSYAWAAHRGAQVRDRRLKEVESQYANLRRSMSDLDVQLQRRMLKLLSWHEKRVLTEREVEEASAPVVEMARKLKERHAS